MMGLLDRVGFVAPSGPSDLATSGDVVTLKRALRSALDRRLDVATITRLVREDPVLARRELIAHLDPLLYGVDGPRADRAVLEQVESELLDDILGLGPIESLLADPTVDEVMVNGPDTIYFERGGTIARSPRSFDDSESLRVAIERIIGPIGRRVDELSPFVNARLADGSRVNVVVPPVALTGPIITIRKFRSVTLGLLDLVAAGSLSTGVANLLSWAVAARRNIAVSGGTGSGKTTLLNALSLEIDHAERIITIEDAAELRFDQHPHVIPLEARPPSVEGAAEVTIRDLLVNALRMRPDRIIVGECRSGEALDMLQAMNTGHDGSLTTLHANSPEDVFTRLATMVRYVADLPVDVIERQIASALDLIVHLERGPTGGRVVMSVMEIGEGGRLLPLAKLDRRHWYEHPHDPCWASDGVPAWCEDLVARGIATSAEVAAWRA